MKTLISLFTIILSLSSFTGFAQSNPILKAELEQILESDQKPRNEYIAALESEPQDTILINNLIKCILYNDSVNTTHVIKILDNHGFPSIEEVGEINIAIWAVIQHSNIELIDKYMPIFLQSAQNGDLPKIYVATMYDRCEAWHNRTQKYGTQGNTDENGVFIPYTLLDSEKVNQWRAEMDLPPLDEYVRQMSRK